MQILIILIAGWIMFLDAAIGACPAAISRSNNSANSVLTSTKYNTDHNTAYSAINVINGTYDGECITADSVPASKIENSTTGPIKRTEIQGCKFRMDSSNSVSVSACKAWVDGTLAESSAASTAVTWGCTGCSAESASTNYYVYIKKVATLALVIRTDTPDAYGYDSTYGRAIGKFWNDGSQDIKSYSILEYDGKDFSGNVSLCGGAWDGSTIVTYMGNKKGCFTGFSRTGTGAYTGTFDPSVFNFSASYPVCVFSPSSQGVYVHNQGTDDGAGVYQHAITVFSGASAYDLAFGVYVSYICTGAR